VREQGDLAEVPAGLPQDHRDGERLTVGVECHVGQPAGQRLLDLLGRLRVVEQEPGDIGVRLQLQQVVVVGHLIAAKGQAVGLDRQRHR
jgi:hypothetical protein